jgi:hypothetical protein
MSPIRLLFALLLVLASCRTIENGAAKDPRKCELDPNCARKPSKYNDCATSCADNIACMDRCRSVTNPMDR